MCTAPRNGGETPELVQAVSGAPVGIQVRCGFGLSLLIGGLEWILVNLTPGAPDIYPVRTAAEEE